MLEKITNLKIPRQTIIYLLMCLSGALIFILVGIIPYQKSLADSDREINNIRIQIEEQKTLSMLREALLKRTGEKESPKLPLPLKGTLSRNQTDQIAAILKSKAGNSNLEVISVSPDLNSMTNSSPYLLLNMVLKGYFFNFRKFLISLGEVPYLERIEEIQIQRNPANIEFKVKIWFALS